jgi:Tol biopolymer transport system component
LGARITVATWSPTEQQIATASEDGTLRVWDLPRGQVHNTLSGPGNQITALAWSPDGRYLVTANADGTVHQYVIDIAALLALAQSRVTRTLTPEERATYLGELLPSPIPVLFSPVASPVSTP